MGGCWLRNIYFCYIGRMKLRGGEGGGGRGRVGIVGGVRKRKLSI